MDDQPRQYLAPANPDAAARTLVLPFSTITFTAQGQVIRSWTFTVFDSLGRIVSQESRLETRDRGFFGELFNLGPQPAVEVPKELSWDGTYHRPGSPEDGSLVPDGDYTYQISIVDSSGGRAQTPPFNATVRNSRISVDYIRSSTPGFSPQGTRKTVSIDQSGSLEFRWEGQFLDSSGAVVRKVVWENNTGAPRKDLSPPRFLWDGKDDQGRFLPDGLYRYALLGVNRAGARYRYELDHPIEISDQTGVVRLLADAGVFSPLAVGAPTTLTFSPRIESPVAVTHWELQVVSESRPEVVRWRASGPDAPPKRVAFEGQTTSGLALPEGGYQAVLSVTLANGNTAESPVVPFRLVVSPPRATLSSSATVFGGSGRSGVNLSFQGEPGIPWDLDLLDGEGKSRRHYSLGTTGAGEVEIQGLDEQGNPLPDGPLTARASGRNSAGVQGSVSLTLRKDSRAVPVGVEVSRATLVPQKGSAGTVRITPVLQVVDSIVRTSIRIRNALDELVADRSVDSILPYWEWTGLTSDDRPAPDGSYFVELEMEYQNGAISRAKAGLIVDSHFLDAQAPVADLVLQERVFAPQNVDGPRTLTIGLIAQQAATRLQDWRLTILDPRGKPFRLFRGTGQPPAQVVWDGRSDGGALVESGEEYQLVLEISDLAGRSAKKADQVAVDILVDKLPDGRYKIVISSIQFAGYSSDLFKAPEPLLSRNLFVLRRLSEVLNRLPNYRINLEGFAVSEVGPDAKAQAREQREELVPLSFERAKEVRTALVLLGVDESRFEVQGYGSLRPIVPNSDLENRWKNRRVEFYLERNR